MKTVRSEIFFSECQFFHKIICSNIRKQTKICNLKSFSGYNLLELRVKIFNQNFSKKLPFQKKITKTLNNMMASN